MKKITPLILVLVFFSLGACRFSGKRVRGNGNTASVERSVKDFSKIKVYADIDVVVEPGDGGVRVEADENIIPYVETKTDDGTLFIKYRRNISLSASNPVKVYVGAKNLSEINVTGSGNISSTAKIVSREGMRFSISGSGDISMEINTPKVDARVSGSGDLNLSGESKDVDVNITGSGNYLGKQLKAENAEISVVGSGDAETFADVHLKARIVGSGNIRYAGNGEVNKVITGSGTVGKME